MFAWVPSAPGIASFAVRLAPSALLVFPLVETLNLGSNLRFWQFASWKESLVVTDCWSAGLVGSAPPPPTVAAKFKGSQLVGLIMKLGRSM